jgi:DNA replication protein DnaC
MLNKQTLEKLFELKLDGMAAAFKEHSSLSLDMSDLSFAERLAMVVDREYTRREEKRRVRRLKTAKLKQPACVEDIDYRHPRGLDKQTVRSLSSCQWIKSHQNIIVTGPTGVGKTYLFCAFVNMACREGYTAIYTRLPILLNDITLAKATGAT